ncbi:hypothetical protein D049_2019B, partial [Vibrio parahaemolyticus VPTS-2010]
IRLPISLSQACCDDYAHAVNWQ